MTKSRLIFFLALIVNHYFGNAQSVNYSDSSVTMPASTRYKAQFLGRVLLGSHYRKVWSAPVNFRYLDMANFDGGLTPLKRGGGFQTKSLRLLSADSNQYVIRTVDKDPSSTVSSIFQHTIVTDIIQDQISASHPYAFLVVPGLAKAANIYHTNPQILYVPDDPLLGNYRSDFKGNIVLFEERLISNVTVEQGLSGFKKVKDTWDVIDALHKNSDNFIDQSFAMRSRLFDMLIGDWDRHEDQWLWAQFNLTDGGKMFRPIPRDRDQAFFNFDGVLPSFASLNIASTRKMQRFKPMPLSVKWFNYNGRNFDHNFLNELTRQQWHDMADSMLVTITDQDIENAFKILPDTIYKLSAPELIKTLKSRRNNLPLIADKYYRFLSKKVIIAGTNKQDLFEIKRSGKNITDVSVFQMKDYLKGKMTYHRTFSLDETKELQLYGLGGNDLFTLDGKSKSSTVVRIIGGEGKDSVSDKSKVGGPGKRTKYYDTEEGNILIKGKETKDKTSSDTALNSYSIKNIDYNFQGVYPLFGYNVDDGIFLGASTTRITYGFKKGTCLTGEPCYNTAPYASKQSLSFDVALKTGAFNIIYKGDFSDVIGKLDLNIFARIQAPNYKYNFFGYGNETIINDSIGVNAYKLRIDEGLLFPSLEIGDEDRLRFLFGPIYQQATVKEDTTGDFFSVFPDLTADNLSRKHYIGANTQFTYDPFRPDSAPKFDVRFLVNTGYLKQIEDNTVNTAFIRGSISFVYNIYGSKTATPVLTFATRFGGGYNQGDFEFYQSNVIGGRANENVRGFRGERFVGRSSLYNNFEIRLRVAKFNAYIFPAEIGLIGLFDNGRVWSDGENSNEIHSSYGGGLWLRPFSLTTLTATIAISKEEPKGLFNLKLGWWF